MSDHLSVTQIVQLIECPSQYHFDIRSGAARSAKLEALAVSGEEAHAQYEEDLRSNPSPTAGDPTRQPGLLVRLVRWIMKLLFGRS